MLERWFTCSRAAMEAGKWRMRLHSPVLLHEGFGPGEFEDFRGGEDAVAARVGDFRD
jgi:hypothetical protein